MHLSDAQAQLLKDWLIKKLEDDSDADSDVLADYVLALVRGDGTPDTLRAVCIDNLRDFLQDGTEAFVDQVIHALNTRSYDPATAISDTIATKPASMPTGPRKRTFDDRDDHSAPRTRYGKGDRPVKQLRRGGAAGQGAGRGNAQHAVQQNSPFPPGMNMQDALGAMLAMQQAMGLPPLPGMEQFTGQATSRTGQRCREFDSKGSCSRGASCRFEHITNSSTAMSYDVSNSSFDFNATRGQRGNHGARGRGRGGIAQNGRRADFSSAGPNSDHSITAIVVENIPEDKGDEQSVRAFFGQFGNIQQLDMQPLKRLAIITFSTWEEANAAYSSPKVIFDNRFVKVFWYKPHMQQNAKPDSSATNGGEDVDMMIAEPEIDHEEIARRQSDAQRKHEEAKRAREEAVKQKQNIDARLKAMEGERKRMAELLARKAAKTSAAQQTSESVKADDTQPQETEQTKALKAQLAKLEAEAKSLGIDTGAATDDPAATSWQPATSWRGRGGFRGRGTFPTRGRAAFRGAWPAVSARGGAVKRLDNRPRTIAVVFPQGTYDKFDEAMRQYLLFTDHLEHATLSIHPDRQDAAMVVFEERYRAENFMAAVKDGIPNIGSVEVTWMSNPISTPTIAANTEKGVDMASPLGTTDVELASKMDLTEAGPVPVEASANLDIAEDDQWD